MRILHQFLHCTRASAAVEAAIFLPFFMLLTFGITDLGFAMFARQQANAAAQAGAAYAIVNSGSICATSTTACIMGIRAAMNNAVGSSTFCNGTVCAPLITPCADGSPKCVSVTASYPLIPILPSAAYSWARTMTISYTAVSRML